jgi:hypothetical protein
MADADCAVMGSCYNGSCTNAIPCFSSYDCAGVACVNGTCAVMCGPMADGCGKLALPAGDDPMMPMDTDCGGCPSGQTCGGGGIANVCGSGKTCTKLACADLGANCGLAGDGCGGMLDCGTCTAPDKCGGNGIPSVCGHVTLDTNASDAPYSQGAFAQQFPDANNMCQVQNLQPARQVLTSTPLSVGPMMMPTLSPYQPDDVGYTWTNVNVYVTAAAQGTQFSADTTYTENGCTASYHVIGMWPAVSCTVTIPDPKDPKGLTPLNQVATPDLCNPCAEPDKQRFVGSGISPDFTTTCKQIFSTSCDNNNPPNCLSADPWGRDPFYCVLAGGDPPQLNPSPPTCLGVVSGVGNGGSGGGGSSPDGGP